MPGCVESIAVSSVQSRKAPFGNSRRCVGTTWADVAGDTVLLSSVRNSPVSERELVAAAGIGRASPSAALAGTATAELAVPDGPANTGPERRRSSASCSGVLAGGWAAPYVLYGGCAVPGTPGWFEANGSGGAGPRPVSIAEGAVAERLGDFG